MPEKRYVAREAVGDRYVWVAGSDLVLQQKGSVAWPEDADPCVPLPDPVTYNRQIALNAEPHCVVSIDLAQITGGV